jgi:hypothetical protein
MDIVERLLNGPFTVAKMSGSILELREAAAEITALRARNAELERALRPFAEAWDERQYLAEAHWSYFRDARQALQETPEYPDADTIDRSINTMFRNTPITEADKAAAVEAEKQVRPSNAASIGRPSHDPTRKNPRRARDGRRGCAGARHWPYHQGRRLDWERSKR